MKTARITMFATLLSTISYLSMPGETIAKGPVAVAANICAWQLRSWWDNPCRLSLSSPAVSTEDVSHRKICLAKQEDIHDSRGPVDIQ